MCMVFWTFFTEKKSYFFHFRKSAWNNMTNGLFGLRTRTFLVYCISLKRWPTDGLVGHPEENLNILIACDYFPSGFLTLVFQPYSNLSMEKFIHQSLPRLKWIPIKSGLWLYSLMVLDVADLLTVKFVMTWLHMDL